ncbi:hypothetical protein HDU93_008493 [Gonapodya sp. JEL0774]|nr:hypothetical protein HDU93_008493 [Gonapodya sp. JEL0774]
MPRALRGSIKFAVYSQRIKATQEAIAGIRVVKFQGWEDAVLERISQLRLSELQIVRRITSMRAWVTGLIQVTPVFAAILTSLSDAVVSLKRLESLLLAEELQPWHSDSKDDTAIKIRDGRFKWTEPTGLADKPSKLGSKKLQNPTGAGLVPGQISNSVEKGLTQRTRSELRNIDVAITTGSLVFVVGPIGSGKSSLLCALIGEMERTSGSLHVRGTVGYCAQTAWVQQQRKNDPSVTEIGERGINLSGGQRQRVSLARCLFADPEVAILDDPLSAGEICGAKFPSKREYNDLVVPIKVDAHVGKQILEEVILKRFAGKTRIMATHQLHILSHGDWILCMKDGEIVEQGTYEDLAQTNGGYLSNMVRDYCGRAEDDAMDTTTDCNNARSIPTVIQRKIWVKGGGGDLTTAEERNEGAVPLHYYLEYIKATGGFLFVFVLVSSLGMTQGAKIGNDTWYAQFTDSSSGSTNLEWTTGFLFGVVRYTKGRKHTTWEFTSHSVLFKGCVRYSQDRLYRFVPCEQADAIRKLFRAPILFFGEYEFSTLTTKLHGSS